ncbi:bifunctional 3-phenylpropionate/cinnamic acid dioxygenase ferredoxin subunit [Micrococcus sp.]|uniref:bifunctional 3-phenylpropionate/cinnamic acid dioxygenase ferredoxin subunit n=1 Tax=Micrococcus sp. TaxID=1271 RepID=UPI002A90BA9D|nr:bifunctional 3-phenylpropionate/cinnamic acid dioxygenase ferredoxin subunit [Micrococcus sp.]MDY6054938.1 bifunctional 3-phenylpropionate/cinnamic acid dioxygenase ferredoxin subunit [Micrococcus sp.]
MAREINVGPASALPEGEALMVPRSTTGTRDDVAIVHAEDGEFYAIDNTCSHQDYALSEGFVEGACIECPLHGAGFDLRTGEALTLPATKPVGTHAVEVRDGDLWLTVEDEA